MKTILSVQSHVTYGHVGNCAAVFPLQRMGFEVMPLNTVQFSTHTGYPTWQGDIASLDHLTRVIDGLRKTGLLGQIDGVLSGYLGASDNANLIASLVQEIREHNPDCCYSADPVMGSARKGCFVAEDIPPTFQRVIVPVASIMTPNTFELSYLTDMPVESVEDIVVACEKLREMGPHTVLVTSFYPSDREDVVQMHLVGASGHYCHEMPRLMLANPPNGAGDLVNALFLGAKLKGLADEVALHFVAEAIQTVLRRTQQVGQRELAIIDAQEAFACLEM